MNILILTEDYPSDKNIYALAYIHSRNIEYLEGGNKVDVISFEAITKYKFEKINVFDESSYKNFNNVDIIISHAPNIKNHFRFLIKKSIQNIPLVFFFHGHEVMNTSKYYPKAYRFNKISIFKKNVQKVYDPLKLKILKFCLLKMIQKREISFIFVSSWMKNMANKSLSLNGKDKDLLDRHSYVVNNGVNDIFLKNTYTQNDKLEADFITIRPFDNSKYGVDIVYNLAKNNPNYSFHIYGEGNFFNHVKHLKNLQVFHHYIHQKDIPDYLNKYKCALMPTRLDAQGVMMCEIAEYGMPLITSDIPICREMLGGFSNVSFVSNNLNAIEISKFIPPSSQEKVIKFNIKYLIQEELDIFNKLVAGV
jgi:hypothetical protein